jgi:hypothetical protein
MIKELEKENKELREQSGADTSTKPALNVGSVSGSFLLANYIKDNYEYIDNTVEGDVYNNINTNKLMTEQEIFDEWEQNYR